MRKYIATAIGFCIGLLFAWTGFRIRLSAHELAGTVTEQSISEGGLRSTVTQYNLYHQSVYQEVGLALFIFGLLLSLGVFYYWIRFELALRTTPRAAYKVQPQVLEMVWAMKLV